jgi:hypothetical protein
VSVEHLWGVLVRQAYIDGLSSLGDGLLLRRGRRWSALVFLLPAAEIQANG